MHKEREKMGFALLLTVLLCAGQNALMAQAPAAAAGRIAITNVLGQTSEQKTPGKLVFTYRGSQYSLATMEEDGNLFIVFADGTTGRTTYQSGRFTLFRHAD